MPLMRPISVSAPVAVTIPVAVPSATIVPLKAIDRRSPSAASGAAGAVSLRTGNDSPVSMASSTVRPATSIRRRSAGTRSPASITTMSPGTSAAASSPCRTPSRRTEARGASMSRRASSACSARPSCTKPMTALTSTTARITPVSIQWPSSAVIAAATIRTMISRLLNCRASRMTTEGRGGSGRRFGPCRATRSAASALLSPPRPLSRARRTSGAVCAHGLCWSMAIPYGAV